MHLEDELDLVLTKLDMEPIFRDFAWLKEVILLAIYDPSTWQESYLKMIGKREGITGERVRQILHKAVWDHWTPQSKQILCMHFGTSIQMQFKYVKPNHIEFITMLSGELRKNHLSLPS